MSHWDEERSVLVFDGECLADGCMKEVYHTEGMQPDLWCKEHYDGFRNSWLGKEVQKMRENPEYLASVLNPNADSPAASNRRLLGEESERSETALRSVLRQTGTNGEVPEPEGTHEETNPKGKPLPPRPA